VSIARAQVPHAQDSVVTGLMGSATTSVLMRPRTAVEVAGALDGFSMNVANVNARQRALEWAKALTASVPQVSGVQLDAIAELFAKQGNDSAVQRVIAARLAERHLTVYDRAFTLQLAVGLLTKQTPAGDVDLSLVRSYMQQLQAMPAVVNIEKASMHYGLMWRYLETGQGADVMREGQRLITLARQMNFFERQYLPFDLGLGLMANLLDGDPRQRQVIDSLGGVLLELAHASPAELALDEGRRLPAVHGSQDGRIKFTQNELTALRGLGAMAPPITATHWFNTAPPVDPAPSDAPAARALPIGKGSILVVALSEPGCPGCIQALPRLQQMRAEFGAGANTEFFYITFTGQRWGTVDCTPDESAEHARREYVDFHHITTLPLGVWAGPLDDTVSEPGIRLARRTPNNTRWHVEGFPTIVIIDGRGILRYRGEGLDTVQVRRVLNYLQREARRRLAPGVETHS